MNKSILVLYKCFLFFNIVYRLKQISSARG